MVSAFTLLQEIPEATRRLLPINRAPSVRSKRTSWTVRWRTNRVLSVERRFRPFDWRIGVLSAALGQQIGDARARRLAVGVEQIQRQTAAKHILGSHRHLVAYRDGGFDARLRGRARGRHGPGVGPVRGGRGGRVVPSPTRRTRGHESRRRARARRETGPRGEQPGGPNPGGPAGRVRRGGELPESTGTRQGDVVSEAVGPVPDARACRVRDYVTMSPHIEL